MPSTIADVLAGNGHWAVECGDCLSVMKSLPDRCVNLVFTSPPYSDQRTYGLGFKLKGQTWVDWLRPIIVECARVSSGLVVVNMASPVKKASYQPEVEWLVADLTRLDGLVCGPSPYAWVKSQNREDADGNGIPGSGAAHYQRRDWEALYTFALPDRLPGKNRNSDFWSDNLAFGHPPKWGAGGKMSNRMADGTRANDPWGKRGRGNNLGGRKPNGEKNLGTLANAPGPTKRSGGEYKAVSRTHTKRVSTTDGDKMVEQVYTVPKISNAGNVIRHPVGGGKQGHKAAHDSEAPMAMSVAERFVCWYVEPDGIICDPMCGSGTTIHAAIEHGRRGIGVDIRQSQIDLTIRRMRTVTMPIPGMHTQ